jgi:hypothetical protein
MIRHGFFPVADLATATGDLVGNLTCTVIAANPVVLEGENCEKVERDSVY